MGWKGMAYFEVPEGCVECYGLEVGLAVRMRGYEGTYHFGGWVLGVIGKCSVYDMSNKVEEVDGFIVSIAVPPYCIRSPGVTILALCTFQVAVLSGSIFRHSSIM
jgi:hypothetical protein